MQTKLKQHLAIATGTLSAAAAPMGAEAAIVYNDSANAFSISFAEPTTESWDVDGINGDDFELWVNAGGGFINLNSSSGLNGRGFVALTAGSAYFNQIPTGFSVGPGLAGSYLWNGGGNYAWRGIMDGSDPGAFNGLQNGVLGSNFVGFRFLSGANTLYGWAELVLATTGGGMVTVNRWAYNDTPDGTIKVGDTGQVPTPPTLALLAAGAFGLRRWRARRAAA